MDKYEVLVSIIRKHRSVAVAFSGGVDSTLLAKVSIDALGREDVLLVTATSSTYPFSELEEAKVLAASLGARHKVIVSEEIDIPGFAQNPPDRCYYCKSELFNHIKHIAEQEHCDGVFDGSNADDTADYRPGRRAIKELGVVSPLLEAGLTKSEIRELSRKLGLRTADKPAYACLASRFPYGETITKQKLDRVGTVEHEIRSLGFGQFRVRSHENLARLEFAKAEMDKGWSMRDRLSEICRKAGYTFVALDAQGYRTGAMNEAL